MSKTILFAQPNSPLIQQLQNEGRAFILAQDPIKTLKAMKKIQKRGEYSILADENSSKYLEVAQKMGYNIHKSSPLTEEKQKSLLENTLVTLKEVYETKFKQESQKLEKEYETKLKTLQYESKNLEEEYEKKFKTIQEEQEKKFKELEVEKNKFKKIKQAIKEKVYG